MLFPASVLAVSLAALPLVRLERAMHLLHRVLFKGLAFYLPPSDAEVMALAPNMAASKASSKTRKRLARRAGADPSAASDQVELQLAAIDTPLFTHAANDRYAQLRALVGVNLTLLALVVVEQVWSCVQLGGGEAAGPMTPLAGSTITLLACTLAYNLWIGVTVVAHSQSAAGGVGGEGGAVSGAVGAASRDWYRACTLLGLCTFAASLFAQTRGALDVSVDTYRAYANQIAFNAATGLHALLEKGVAAAGEADSPSIDWLPTRPLHPESMHIDALFSLGSFRVLLGVVCASVSVAFLASAWRFSRLLVEKLDDNAEAWRQDSIDEDDEDKGVTGSISRVGRARIALSTTVHIVNFLAPLFVGLMWLPPFAAAVLHTCQSTLRIDASDAAALYTVWRTFEVIRAVLTSALLVLRLALLRSFLQTFLLSALGLIRLLPRVASTTPTAGVDRLLALRVQTLLKGLFWCVPLVALQLAYPALLGLALVATHKLAEEHLPTGFAESHTNTAATSIMQLATNAGRDGWGLCLLVCGRAASAIGDANAAVAEVAANVLPVAADAVAAAAAVAQSTMSTLTAAPLDEDEFDGDLVDDAFDASPLASSATNAAAASTSTDTFAAALMQSRRTNVIASAIGFVVAWSHLAWFIETTLCIAYLRFVRPAAAARRAATTQASA